MLDNREPQWGLFGRNVSKPRKRVRKYSLPLFRNYDDPDNTADKAAQWTFENQWSNPRGIDINNDPFPLLCKNTQDPWKDYCRQRTHETPQKTVSYDEHAHRGQALTSQQYPPDASKTRTFDQAFETLTPTNRAVAFCYAYLDLPPNRTATVVGLSTSDVEYRWRNIIQPQLQQHARKSVFSCPTLVSVVTVWLQRLRDNAVVTPPAGRAMTTIVLLLPILPITVLSGPTPAPPPPEQIIINVDPITRTPAVEPTRPPLSTPAPTSPPHTAQSPSATTSTVPAPSHNPYGAHPRRSRPDR